MAATGDRPRTSTMTRVSLVVSDVDGTLVTPDKRLTEATMRAAQRLAQSRIDFTVVSSRPPAGMRMLVEPLSLRLPMGDFSGGATVTPALEVIEQHVIPEAAARTAADLLDAFAADAWLFTVDGWFVRDARDRYIPRETRTIQAEPSVVASFDAVFGRACKIVGSSEDFARLGECESAMRDALGSQASVVRSQPYYLDVTPPGRDKGTFVEGLSRHLGIPLEAIAVLGDMENDLAMFRKAGMAIAMGNASAAVKSAAKYVAGANTADGFATAIERYVLGDGA
jgi:Cof subfamily protein (haloacid dehalogenase superfamily)